MIIEVHNKNDIVDIGAWLDHNMPNPPLPDTQRWSLGYHDDSDTCYIRFSSSKDATLFALRWS